MIDDPRDCFQLSMFIFMLLEVFLKQANIALNFSNLTSLL